MLKRLMPHTLVQSRNPVFEYDLRRVRRFRTPQALRRYSLYVLLGTIILLIGLWVLNLANYVDLYTNTYRPGSRYVHSGMVGATFSAVVVATFLIMLIADLYYILLTVSAINRQVTTGQWDVLRLTSLRINDILTAKYSVAQIRAWRGMALEVGSRILLISLILLMLVLDPDRIASAIVSSPDSWLSTMPVVLVGDGSFVAAIGRELNQHLFATIGLCLSVLILAAAYTLELLWRMRAIIALGLRISAQVHSLTFAILAALAALFGMRLVQGFMLVFVASAIAPLLMVQNLIGSSDQSVAPVGPPLFVLLCLTVAFLVRRFYQSLQHNSLQKALRFANRSE